MGDKQLQLETALEKLRIEAFAFSRHPQELKQNLGRSGAGHLLNQVAEVETWMTPEDLLETLLAIEQEMGACPWGQVGATCDWSSLLYMDDTICYSLA